MRKMCEVLQLRHALSLSYREIGEALGISKTAAGEIVRRAGVIGLSWPLPQLSTMASLSAGCSRPLERRKRSARLPIGPSCTRNSSGAA